MALANLALRRPALQSSVSRWSSDESPAVDAAAAVSGDADSARFFHTDQEFFPWWRVDLGRPSRISRVEIDNRPGPSGGPTRLTLLGSLDGRSWRGLGRVRGKAEARYVVEFTPSRLARFIKLRLDGFGALHLRQCRVFGEPGDDAAERAQYAALEAAWPPPAGRSGEIVAIGGFDVFVDDAYAERIRDTLNERSYERRERLAACRLLKPGDRVMEAGAAIGLVGMTAAAIVGPANVVGYDANPAMIADAAANFARNGMRVELHAAALAPRRRFVEGARLAFQVEPEFWASRLVEAGAADAVSVPTLCLEAERQRRDANVLICDIEGGEVELLSEADLSSFRLVIVETHDWAVGRERTDALIRKLIVDGFNLDLDVTAQAVVALRR